MSIAFVGLVIICCEGLARRYGFAAVTRGRWVVRDGTMWFACAVLLAAYAMQLHVLHLQAIHEEIQVAAHPIPTYIGRTFNPQVHGAYTLLFFGASVVEVLALAALASGARRPMSARSRAVFAGATAGLAALSLTAPALSSSDVYDYLTFADLGFAAYQPPLHRLDQGLNYGPLWLVVDQMVTAAASSVVAKIVALRAFGAVLVVVCSLLLRAGGLSPSTQIAFLLNPALWFASVANAHNDLWALAFVLGAYACARTRPWWTAALLLGLAGGTKLPLLVAGVPALYPLQSRAQRYAAFGVAVVLTLALSAFGGTAYAQTLFGYSALRVEHAPGIGRVVLVGVELLFAAATLVGLSFATLPRGMAWLAPQLTPLPFPWYVIWGIPFVLGSDIWAQGFLVTLPVFATFMDYNYDAHAFAWAVVAAAALAAAAFTIVRARRREP